MNFIDQIAQAFTPHAKALGVGVQYHSDRIVGELSEIRKHMSDLGRGDYGDMWQRFTLVTAAADATYHELLPELRVPLNEIWLVQVLTGTNAAGTAGTYRFVNDNGQTILALDSGTSGDFSTIVGGSVAFMPGEHITAQANAATGVSSLMLMVIRRQAPEKAAPVHLGPRSEAYSGKNTHRPDRDFDGRTPQDGWHVDPPQTLASEGLMLPVASHKRLNEGTLDPTGV